MRVLITGANGFLGKELIGRFAEQGVSHIRCFLREGSDLTELNAIVDRYPQAEIEIYFGTLTSREDCQKAVTEVDTIYHLASTASGAIADMYFNTVVGTKYLLEAMVKENDQMQVVFLSSFAVYGVSDLAKSDVISEDTPLEQHPEKRDPYSFVKFYQEKIVLEFQEKHGFPLAVLRPGVIYGPGRGEVISSRVGMNIAGFFLHLGGRNPIPLSYISNCADAVITAADHCKSGVEFYNVHDGDMPTSKAFLKAYQKNVQKMRVLPIPYFLFKIISRMVQWYHDYSKGQLPAIFTVYKTEAMWKGNDFDNSKIVSIGWKQNISTQEGMEKTFASVG